MNIQVILKTRWFQTTAATLVAFAGGATLGYILGKDRGTVTIVPPEPDEKGMLPIFDMETSSFVYETVPVIPHQYKAECPVEQRVCSNCGVTDGNADQVVNNFYYCSGCAEIARGEVITVARESTIELNDDQDELPFEDPTPEEFILVTDTKKPAKHNVFTNQHADWDYDEEVSKRNKSAPYIIHEDEYISSESEYRQETLTYYQGDDIMADPTDTPIYNHHGIIGELLFGHGSNDPGVVYVRNDQLEIEWEILLHTGSFEQEVLGLQLERLNEKELRHSVQKFRRE